MLSPVSGLLLISAWLLFPILVPAPGPPPHLQAGLQRPFLDSVPFPSLNDFIARIHLFVLLHFQLLYGFLAGSRPPVKNSGANKNCPCPHRHGPQQTLVWLLPAISLSNVSSSKPVLSGLLKSPVVPHPLPPNSVQTLGCFLVVIQLSEKDGRPRLHWALDNYSQIDSGMIFHIPGSSILG